MGDQRKGRHLKFNVLRFVLIVFSGFMFLLSFAFANSEAADYSISDQASCESLPAGVMWQSPATCILISDLLIELSETLEVPQDVIFVIPKEQYLANSGYITNLGTIEVLGTLDNIGTIENVGAIENTGFFFNYRDIVNDGAIYNYGSFTSGPNSTLTNNGTFEDESSTLCPPGTTYDEASDICTAEPVYSCPEGTVPDGSKCVAEPDWCPGESEMYFDTAEGQWKCTADPGLTCPDNTMFFDDATCYSVEGCPGDTLPDLTPGSKECFERPSCTEEDYEFRTEQFTNDAFCELLGDEKVCPEGSTYEEGQDQFGGKKEGICILDEVPPCPEGGEKRGGYCYNEPLTIICPPETTFDGFTCTATPECDDGMELFGGICQVEPEATCPSGTSLDSITKLCTSEASCPNGYDYSYFYNSCRRTNECSGSTYNSILDLCVKNASKSCSQGSLNDAGFCAFSKGLTEGCPDGWTWASYWCTKSPSYSCSVDYYKEGSKCYKFPTCSGGGIDLGAVCQASLGCPDGTVLSVGDLCIATPSLSCSAGSLDIAQVWCTADATCPEYTQNDYLSGTCWSVPIDTTCPAGYEYHTLSGKCRRSICPDGFGKQLGSDTCYTYRSRAVDEQRPCPKGFKPDWENQDCVRGISYELDPCPSGSVFDYERVVCKSNEDLNDSMFKCPEGLDLEYKRTSYLDPHEEFWCVSDKKCSEGFEENEDSGFCEAGLQVCPDGMSIDGISCIGETNDNCPAGTDFNPDSCEESSSLFCPPDDPALLTGRCEGDKVSTCPPGTSAGNSTEIKCSGPKLLQCPPGTYDDNGTCLVVPAGTFTDQLGSTVLNICPANGYCPEASVFPLPCPPGTTAPEGSSSADQCVPDIDGDSIADDSDNCPLDANTDQVDTDWDTLGNACDPDDDNDQQTDVDEISCGSDPLDETSLSPDNDGDFSPDCVDDDDDNDGVLDTDDSCPFEDATGLDADIDGCIDNFAGLADFIGSLASGGVMNQNLADPLIAKVENAVKSDAKDNICTAVNQLGAFKNQVEAKRGKQLPDDAADQLMQYADNIIIQLFAKLPEGESCK